MFGPPGGPSSANPMLLLTWAQYAQQRLQSQQEEIKCLTVKCESMKREGQAISAEVCQVRAESQRVHECSRGKQQIISELLCKCDQAARSCGAGPGPMGPMGPMAPGGGQIISLVFRKRPFGTSLSISLYLSRFDTISTVNVSLNCRCCIFEGLPLVTGPGRGGFLKKKISGHKRGTKVPGGSQIVAINGQDVTQFNLLEIKEACERASLPTKMTFMVR